MPPGEHAPSAARVRETAALVDMGGVGVPLLANCDETGALAAEPGVHVRYVSQPADLRAPDLVILPGTKTTIPDLLWLTERGLADRIRWLAPHGTPVLGICGGHQMLARPRHDPDAVDSDT